MRCSSMFCYGGGIHGTPMGHQDNYPPPTYHASTMHPAMFFPLQAFVREREDDAGFDPSRMVGRLEADSMLPRLGILYLWFISHTLG